MFNDIDWTKQGNSSACVSNAREVRDYAKDFQRGHLSFFRKWYGTCNYKPEGKWGRQAGQMIEFFAQSGHPVFRGRSAEEH